MSRSVDNVTTTLFEHIAISETGFLFDPRTGQSFLANETAIEALKALRSGCDLPTTVAQLAEKYEAAPETISAGLEGFLRQLARYFA